MNGILNPCRVTILDSKCPNSSTNARFARVRLRLASAGSATPMRFGTLASLASQRSVPSGALRLHILKFSPGQVHLRWSGFGRWLKLVAPQVSQQSIGGHFRPPRSTQEVHRECNSRLAQHQQGQAQRLGEAH